MVPNKRKNTIADQPNLTEPKPKPNQKEPGTCKN